MEAESPGIAFPYDRPRPGQLEAARLISEAISEGRVVALRAPTGFGKTATIIKGLLDSGAKRVIYVVRTRNEIQPVIRELRRFGLRDYTFLYSARRMCPLLEEENLGVDDFWNTCRLLRLRGECAYYSSLSEVNEDDVRRVVSSKDSPRGIVKDLAHMGVCPFFALKLLVSSAHIVVATYPYLFREDIFETVFEPFTLSDFVIVVDEAHSLLNLQSLFEARLSVRDIELAITEIENYNLPLELAEKLEELREIAANAKASEKLTRLSIDDIREVLEEPSIWRDAAEEVRLEKTRERLEEGAPVSLSVALTRVAVFADAAWRKSVGAYLSRNNNTVLKILPLEPCDIVGNVINNARAAILASGTLPERDAIRTLMCIEKELVYLDVEELYGPIFPQETLAVMVTAELTSRYSMRSTRMYRLYAEYIAEAYHATKRSVLAVYPSYEMLRSIHSFLSAMLGDKLISENRGTSIEDVAERVRREKHVVIEAVAGGKLTEGIELRDNRGQSLVSVVFVAGVPYPLPDDYVEDQVETIAEKIGEQKAKTMFFEVNAAMRILQAVGRARRSSEDTALVVLGDYRFLRRGIRRHISELTRRYRVVNSIEEYRALVKEVAQALDL